MNQENAAELRSQIVAALRSYPLAETDAGNEVRALAPRCEIEGPEAFSGDVLLSEKEFSGSFVWHVTLHFLDEAGDLTTSETFPGIYRGRLDKDGPVIDRVEIDLSSLAASSSSDWSAAQNKS